VEVLSLFTSVIRKGYETIPSSLSMHTIGLNAPMNGVGDMRQGMEPVLTSYFGARVIKGVIDTKILGY